MNVDLAIAIGAGLLVTIGLLFLSGIHIFMIPKDVLKRETQKREPKDKPKTDDPSTSN